MKNIIFVFLLIFEHLWALDVGEKLTDITLSKENGGYLNGEPWSASDMNAKANIIFYVDPDVKDLNDPFARKLQSLNAVNKEFKVFVIINMDASWIPNALIQTVLKSKQKEFPQAIYVKDNKKTLVARWHLEDDNSDIVIVDSNGKVYFLHNGEMNDTLSQKAISKINDICR